MTDEEKKNLKNRVADFEKQELELLDKYGLERSIDLEFPRYREYPADLQLALLVINGHGGKYSFSYGLKSKEDTKVEEPKS